MPDEATLPAQVSVPSPIGNKKVRAKKEAFCNLVAENKARPFYVCSHDNPDPDSLASAYCLKRVLHYLGVEHVEVYYCGEISHPQNRAMHVVLNIPCKRWTKQIQQEVNNASTKPVFIFVDCVAGQRNMSIPFAPSVCIDHHKVNAPKNGLFIHDEIGACSTLVTDLALQMAEGKNRCLDPNAEGVRELATALAVGIKTDTMDFLAEATSDDDFRAYKLLGEFINDDKFHRIVNYELPPYIFDAERIAWENRVYQAPNLITGLGYLDDARSDCIPYLADKMMRLQGIQTVVVYAIVGRTIRGSVRTNSAAHEAQNLVAEIFGEGSGGGKYGVGGARVEFNVLDIASMSDSEKDNLWKLVKSSIERRFAKAMG